MNCPRSIGLGATGVLRQRDGMHQPWIMNGRSTEEELHRSGIASLNDLSGQLGTRMISEVSALDDESKPILAKKQSILCRSRWGQHSVALAESGPLGFGTGSLA